MREHKGRSIISLPNDYVVIDTETTGLDYSICELIEVSALRYSNGVLVDSFSSLIQPAYHNYVGLSSDGREETWGEYVDSFITDLTGITNEMLRTAPIPEDVIPKFMEFIGSSILIGHNIHFDINFLYDAAIRVCGVPLSNDFVDTLRIARKAYPDLDHHRLADIAEACEVSNSGAHRADNDCKTAAECYKRMRSDILSKYTEEAFIKSFAKKCRNYTNALKSVTATVTSIDETNPIFGKVVVFTGALTCMTRKDAFQIVANLGGIPTDKMNAKTNYLVIGNVEFANSVKDGKTNKMKKAEDFIKKGKEISVISESTFFDLISNF